MKSTTFISVLAILFISFGIISCDSSSDSSINSITSATTAATLSAEEIQDLTFLNEEEKLARDIYHLAGTLYNNTVFSSIEGSENKHMSAVENQIDIYQVEAVTLGDYGVFQDSTLQAVYNDLAAQVQLSELEALKVGAFIEELDINDLDHMLEHTETASIVQVYTNLRCGSENHLRAFVGQIQLAGATYEPQILDNEYYDQILASQGGGCGNN